MAWRYPKGLPKRYRWHWDHPWSLRARQHRGFKRWLREHGYLSPNFSLAEARCKDGTPVPRSLRVAAQRHAFNLERLRHALGDRPISIISWYRHAAYNRRIGGASRSKHVAAIATDHSTQWVNRMGRSRVRYHGNRIFANGGMGTYPAGSMHFDTRGYKARWSSF